MINDIIGPRIKKIRKNKGLTQEQLAESLGYSHKSVITHIEKGDAEMSYEKMLLLLRKFALDANELFEEVETIDHLIEEHEEYKKEQLKIEEKKKDIKLNIKNVNFSYRVGGFLIKDNKILLTKRNNKYTIPGGHIRVNETSEEALIREFKEETNIDVEISNFVATLENFFNLKGNDHHEIVIYYKLNILNEENIKFTPDQEKTTFEWVKLEELNNIKLLPKGVNKLILGKNKKSHIITKK
jgi:ADP-ribose pyrophosphatase YjhB (NUDIX family)/DNA-binding XRE family transcriptional regulator